MEEIKNIINDNSDKFEHFSYYMLLIDKIEKNLNSVPDIAIESCKSLIEGICKTILISLDNTISESDISGERYPFVRLYKVSMDKLAEVSDEFEVEFVRGFNNNIRILGEIRTKRGDICHGKMAPKELCSSQKFAFLIQSFTTSLLLYILEYYFNLDFEKGIITYEDNQDFNDKLDDLIVMPSIKYSKALFEQDIDLYLEQLKEYESEKEELVEIKDVFEKEELVEIEDVSEVEKLSEIEGQLTEKIIEDDLNEVKLEDFNFISSSEIFNKLIAFAEEEDIYLSKLVHIIDTYLFDEREPLSSEIASSLKYKLKLIDRKKKINDLKEKILKLVEENLRG